MENIAADLLGFPNIKVEKVDKTETSFRFFISSTEPTRTCKCGTNCTKVQQRNYHHLRDLPIFDKEVRLCLTVRQFYCPTCKKYFSETFDFVRSRQKSTIRLEEWIFH